MKLKITLAAAPMYAVTGDMAIKMPGSETVGGEVIEVECDGWTLTDGGALYLNRGLEAFRAFAPSAWMEWERIADSPEVPQ